MGESLIDNDESESKGSKFEVDAELFKPEPPIGDKQIKALFHGRELELRRGIETLKASWDTGGRRSKSADKRPWVIHGESRSGKSHLARRILIGLPKSKKRIKCTIAASGRLTALTVMRELFNELTGVFNLRVLDQRLLENPLRLPTVKVVKDLISKVALFEPGAENASLTFESGTKSGSDFGLELGGSTKLVKFLAKFQSERSEKAGVQISLRPPTATDLAELCGVIVETLLQIKLLNHALVLVDDVDLLEGFVSPDQGAREQRSLLADALAVLHASVGVDVVITARSWYAHSRKELRTLVDLAESQPMTTEELTGIHDCRFRTLAKKNGPKEFLERPALSRLAGLVDGLRGVFLQHLDTAFYRFQNEDGWDARSFDWLLNVFRTRLELIREKCEPGMESIEAAIKSGRLVVDVSQGNPFFGTMLDNEFVHQSYYSETSYFMSGLMRHLVAPSEELELKP